MAVNEQRVVLTCLEDTSAGRAVLQGVLNHAVGYVEESFGHHLVGVEGRQLFELLALDAGAERVEVFSVDLKTEVCRTIGFITLGLGYSDWDGGYIHYLVLDDRYRRQGYGTLAVQVLEQRLAQQVSRVRLKVYPPDSFVVSFWQSLGYRVTARLPVSFKPQAGMPTDFVFLEKQMACAA